MKPLASTGVIQQVWFANCTFAREVDSTDVTSTGILIDTDTGSSTNVSDISLNDCMSYGWNGPGLQINAGQNIVIAGGRYGSNALSAPTSGGIAITGVTGTAVPTNITINGADCTSQVASPSYGAQPYAISITVAVAGLYVRGCNLTGYGAAGPVYASSAGTQVEITDCAGYNDQAKILQQPPVPPPSGTFHNYSAWPNATSGWFGRIAFYIWGGNVTHVHIDGVQTNLTSGGFELGPGESASIDSNALPAFLAVGK